MVVAILIGLYILCVLKKWGFLQRMDTTFAYNTCIYHAWLPCEYELTLSPVQLIRTYIRDYLTELEIRTHSPHCNSHRETKSNSVDRQVEYDGYVM